MQIHATKTVLKKWFLRKPLESEIRISKLPGPKIVPVGIEVTTSLGELSFSRWWSELNRRPNKRYAIHLHGFASICLWIFRAKEMVLHHWGSQTLILMLIRTIMLAKRSTLHCRRCHLSDVNFELLKLLKPKNLNPKCSTAHSNAECPNVNHNLWIKVVMTLARVLGFASAVWSFVNQTHVWFAVLSFPVYLPKFQNLQDVTKLGYSTCYMYHILCKAKIQKFRTLNSTPNRMQATSSANLKPSSR